MIAINECFSIGYRCTTDLLLESMNIRKYSSPFSYMVIDLETSLNFIKNNFKNYLNVHSYKLSDHCFLWNNKKWNHNLYVNNFFKLKEKKKNISDYERICCWNHHDLSQQQVIKSFHKRINHLLHSLNNKNTLLIYIDNIKQCKDNTNSLIALTQNYLLNTKNDNVHILLLFPLIDFGDKEPYLIKKSNNLNIIYYKSNMEGAINDINNKQIQWSLISDLIFKYYKFDIAERDCIFEK